MKQITKECLNRAQDGLDVIEEILTRKNLTNMTAFHSQQAVEKISVIISVNLWLIPE